MIDKVKNFVIGYVKQPPSPSDTGTSLIVDSQYATNFPDPNIDDFGEYRVVVSALDVIATPQNTEIVRVTAKNAVGGGQWVSGNDCQLTIERIAEGESSREIIANDCIYQSVTADQINDINDDFHDLEGGDLTEVKRFNTIVLTENITFTTPIRNKFALRIENPDSYEITWFPDIIWQNDDGEEPDLAGITATLVFIKHGSDYFGYVIT
jgi:hypothetical protein